MSATRQYTDAMLAGMQAAYGDGFLSPGAAPDMRRLLRTVEVEDKRVLDFGCGVGGATVMFTGEFAARHVTAADPEPQALLQTAGRVAAAVHDDHVTTVQIDTGPLPFPDHHFDIAYSKDVICHIADKEAIFQEMHRVLTPGGTVALGDWTVGTEQVGGETLAIWQRQLAAGGLIFHFEQAANYAQALRSAGFVHIEIDDISPVFLAGAAEELAKLLGADQVNLQQVLGVDGAARRIALTRARHDALLAGSLAYHHVRART